MGFGWLIGAAERRVRSQLSFSSAPTGTSDGDEEREWIIFISGAGAPSAEVGDLCSLDDPLLLGGIRAS